MLADIDFKEKPAIVSYKDMEQLRFQILLPDSYYVNTSGIHICFPVTDSDDDLVTVNNFSAYLVKEISVTRYGSDKKLIPTFSPYEVYQ